MEAAGLTPRMIRRSLAMRLVLAGTKVGGEEGRAKAARLAERSARARAMAVSMGVAKVGVAKVKVR